MKKKELKEEIDILNKIIDKQTEIVSVLKSEKQVLMLNSISEILKMNGCKSLTIKSECTNEFNRWVHWTIDFKTIKF